MVGTLAKLQLTLAWRGVRSSTGRIIGTVIMGIYGLGLTALLVFGLVMMRTPAMDAWRGPVLTLAFGLVTLGWPLITMFTAGSNELLDPGRFALFPVTARQLIPGLFAAAMLGAGALDTALLALGTVISWSGGLGTAVAAAVGAVLGVATCVISARALTALMSRVLASRRFRDVGGVAFFAVIMAVSFGMQFGSRIFADSGAPQDVIFIAARITSWTPFGWAWALPWDVAQGAWLPAAAHLVLAAALVWALLRLWERSLARALVSPLDSAAVGGTVKSGRFDFLAPRGPIGAVARRDLRYWRRDPRRLIQLLAVIVVPVFMFAPGLAQGMSQGSNFAVDFAAVLGGVIVASTLAWSISYDGSALWMQVLSGVTGREDRIGRCWSVTIVTAPYLLVVLFGSLFLTGDWQLLPGLIGALIAAFGSSLGVGSLVGALWQQAMPAPGGNVFSRGSGTTAENFLGSMVAMIAPIVLTAPSLALAIVSWWKPWAGWAAIVVGLVIGSLACWAGVRLGGRHLDKHWPEVLNKVKETHA
ncbi:hypothetical protein [Propionibacterium freudenreichii]|uniref:hypothetical protein n=1 Tax=Propionibacterium freudenreichii TaxID=1744 RepID=UPI000543B3DB|nr:hypothetical protein [Propionibacterium freudenreichii]AJQ90301.1 Putative integral membrane transport protein [Propionibacterium freudenreichii subsp. freudenreichii]MCT2973277.1 hypothetical protein [Propionibacterium freudenreichii]MCT2979189.1 hypothetical protein [Propionibacterium freudenreichii]MCT2980193.1 hypothetical protein [Propionibacterium freudenreichii]MCT2984600.1 hypothetical protein [Propionibacterium freudenreichii]